jgi:hypothetical protein
MAVLKTSSPCAAAPVLEGHLLHTDREDAVVQAGPVPIQAP